MLENGILTEPSTAEPQQWNGWNTALKPANEPIVLARKPLSEKTIAENVIKWGTGAINIDACRVGLDGGTRGAGPGPANGLGHIYGNGLNGSFGTPIQGLGRWPANVITDGSEEVLEVFPGDRDSAARFFYSAKASKKERAGSIHPTVKPIKLLRYLTRLITPPNGIVLDPFAGTGTTGEAAYLEGFKCYLMEREEEYQQDIRTRFKSSMKDDKEEDSITNKPKNPKPSFFR